MAEKPTSPDSDAKTDNVFEKRNIGALKGEYAF